MSRKITFVAVLFLLLNMLVSSGCSWMSEDRTHAIIAGASLGALAGGAMGCGAAAAWGYTSHHSNDARLRAFEVGCPIGGVLGAIVGGAIGASMYTPPAPPAPVVAQAPPPPPPPPPPPAPAPQERIVLRGVHFDFDKYNIRPDAVPILDEAADILNKHPDLTVDVNGYCDIIGGFRYNQRLSERRAAAVARYLEGKGIPANHLVRRGYGKTHFVATNTAPEGRAQNRRVELVPENQ